MNVIWMGGKDSRKSIRSIDLLPWPIDMVATDRNLFVVHHRDDTMSVVRVRTLETMEYSTARTGKSPFAIAIRP